MEMHQVRYFLAMARALNFTRAADACNVSQPSLTKAIQKLEDEFGGPLFRRERARTHLTDLGRLMLPHLERTFEAAQAAKTLARDVGKAQVAPLALGVASPVRSAALDAVLVELGAGLPGFELTIRGGSSRALVADALAGDLDLVIVESLDDVPERLEAWPLYDIAYHLLVAAGHPLATRGRVILADLAEVPWIDCGSAGLALLRARIEDGGGQMTVRHAAGDEAQLRRLIAAGLGCAFAARIDDPRIAAVAVEDLAASRGVVLAAITGRRRPLAADAFIRAARARDWSEGSV